MRCLLLVFVVWGCDDGGSGGGGDAMDAASDANQRVLGDAQREDAAMEPEGDAAMEPEDAAMEPEDGGPPPDAGEAVVVSNCAEACARYAACEALEGFGDESACLDACELASREGAPQEWFDCLEGACAEVRGCEVPEPNLLDCEVACQAVTDCEANLPVEDCAAACAEGPAVALCAESLIDGQCEGAAFTRCLGARLLPDCGALCSRAVECNIREEAECYADCFEDLDGADALAQERVSEHAMCVTMSGEDCFRVNQCIDPDASFGLGHTCQEACEGLQECDIVPPEGLADCLGQCEAERLADPEGYQWVIDCNVEYFVASMCDPGALQSCLTLEPVTRKPPCEALCEARTLCEQEEMPQAQCVEACNNALVDPAQAGLWRLQLPCGRVPDCEALTECLVAADPEPECAAWCGELDACELGSEDCQAECEANFLRGREATSRACVGEIEEEGEGRCAAVEACVPPPTPPCRDYCQRLLDCNQLGEMPDLEACVRSCDDDHHARPEDTSTRIGCVLSAPECDSPDPFNAPHAVSACVLNPAVGEAASLCLPYCRATAECAEPAEDVAECITACAEGFGDASALRFVAAAPCLLELGGAPTCAELSACIPEAVEVDCEARCGAVEDCRIPEEGCAEACGEAPDADVAGCVLEAEVRGLGCRRIAECVDFELGEVPPSCEAVCAKRAGCDEAVDDFLCLLDCPEAGVPIQAACAEVVDCDALDACLDLGAEPDEDCVEACGEAPCGVEDCAESCTGRAGAPNAPDGFIEGVGMCVGELEAACAAEDLAACLDVETVCERGCRLLSACNPGGLVGTPEECTMLMCPNGPIEAFWQGNIDCALMHFDDNACDEMAFFACLGF